MYDPKFLYKPPTFLYSVALIKIGLDVGQIEKLRDVRDVKSEDSDCDVRLCLSRIKIEL